MHDDLFPMLWGRGNDTMSPDGMDADTGYHRQQETPTPKLTVTSDGEIGKLYGPDGKRYRTVMENRPRVPFGFTRATDEGAGT